MESAYVRADLDRPVTGTSPNRILVDPVVRPDLPNVELPVTPRIRYNAWMVVAGTTAEASWQRNQKISRKLEMTHRGRPAFRVGRYELALE